MSSEITTIQKQLKEVEDAKLNTPQDNLEDEVLVDTLALEDERVLSGDQSQRKGRQGSVDREDHLQEEPLTVSKHDALVDTTEESLEESREGSLEESLVESEIDIEIPSILEASLFEDVEYEEAPPMIRAMRTLGRLLDADLAQRALELGDDGALNEARTSLLQLVEDGLTPGEVQSFFELSSALAEGVSRLSNGAVSSELVVGDIIDLKSIVDSGIVVTDAVHSEIWNGDDETILAFQNLSQSDADEVQEDLSTLDEETIAPEDKLKIKAEGVTAIEIEEVLVGFWEAAQNEEYEVVEEEDVD